MAAGACAAMGCAGAVCCHIWGGMGSPWTIGGGSAGRAEGGAAAGAAQGKGGPAAIRAGAGCCGA
eukprot:14835488-Alexandrium_andersonii.AAC.1